MGRKPAIEINAEDTAEEETEVKLSEGTASIFDGSEYPDGRVRILRVDDRSQRRVSHGYFPVDVTEEDVSNAFGGGSYRAQLNSPDPVTGRVEIRKTKDFTIIGTYKPPQKINTFEDVGPHGPASTPATAAAVASSAPNIPGGGDDLMQVLKAGIINTLLELMSSTKKISTPSGPDPLLLQLMESQAKTQQQMMQFMLTLATKNDGEGKDMLSMMAKMKELVSPVGVVAAGGAVDPMQMFNTMLETFTRMREVADDISPHKEPEDPLLGSIPKLVEVVAEQHQLNKAQRERSIQMRRVPGKAGGEAQLPIVTETVTSTAPTPPTDDLAMWQRILRQQAGFLTQSAQNKADPDVIAGMGIMFATPPMREALAIFFHRDEAMIMADIFTEVPPLAEHKEWVTDFVQAVQERLFPDEFSDEDDVTGDDEHGGQD